MEFRYIQVWNFLHQLTTWAMGRTEQPPIELSPTEQSIVKRIKRAKLFTFLRECRHELFHQSFQQELSKLYADSIMDILRFTAQLALVIIRSLHWGIGCRNWKRWQWIGGGSW